MVAVEAYLEPEDYPDGYDELYSLKDLSVEIDADRIQYVIRYEFKPDKIDDIFHLVQAVLIDASRTDVLNNEDTFLKVKMNLLPVEFYTYSIFIPGRSPVPYDTLRQFRYTALEAERDDFSRSKERLGSKALVRVLQKSLTNEDKIKIEKEYTSFLNELKGLEDIQNIINWQEVSDFKEAEKFFEHINILPNIPPVQSLLNSVRLGYLDEGMNLQGLGFRNLILMVLLINSMRINKDEAALNILTVEEPEAHLCINNIRLMANFFNAVIGESKTTQLFYSTHSTEFINKMDLKNVIILHDGQAFSLLEELEEEERDYLTKNPNLDLFKLFFSKKCVLFEGISEEMLIRSYINSKKELNDIEVISFHKGYKKIIEIWRKLNTGTDNKLGIIRDFDGQKNAQNNHEIYNDDKTICVRTTSESTLEPEIVKTGDNFKILNEKYPDMFECKTPDEMQELWVGMKAEAMLRICKDIEQGELPGFQMPKHIQEVLDFM